MAIMKTYRFRDLLPGDRFYCESYPYDLITVASVWDGRNAWRGNVKMYFNPNAKITPADKRKAARNRLSMIRKVCKENGITLPAIREAYRSAVFKQKNSGTEAGRKHNAGVVESLPPEIRAALGQLDLIIHVNAGNSWDYYPMVAGSFFGQFI